MSSEVHTTTDHQTIRQWAEHRGGRPATVATTGSEDDPGILRIDFPDYGAEENLEAISWEAFFETFDKKRLAFVYQETMKDGRTSRFSKFISRDSA